MRPAYAGRTTPVQTAPAAAPRALPRRCRPPRPCSPPGRGWPPSSRARSAHRPPPAAAGRGCSLAVLRRKGDREGGAAPRAALHFDLAAVVVHDPLADPQAEAGALGIALRGVERLKDVLQVLLGDAAARVPQLDHHVASGEQLRVRLA